jgi:hypothetical protein
MPPALTYPGVYIQELSDGIPAIEGVPTSITAFIGRAERGPSDKPVLIHDFADYHERFGGIWAESTMIGADHLASEWKYIPVRRLALYAERSQSARRAMAHPLQHNPTTQLAGLPPAGTAGNQSTFATGGWSAGDA